MPAERDYDCEWQDQRVTADAKGEHPGPRLAFRITITDAEYNEGKPSEEEQTIQQRATGDASGNAEQRTLGSKGSNQDEDKHDGIDRSIAVEARLAERLGERKQTAFQDDALHHGATQGKHHKPTVQAVVGMPEEPAQALIVENTAAWYAQSRQNPRKKRQQRGQHQAEYESSFLIVHQPQDCQDL